MGRRNCDGGEREVVPEDLGGERVEEEAENWLAELGGVFLRCLECIPELRDEPLARPLDRNAVVRARDLFHDLLVARPIRNSEEQELHGLLRRELSVETVRWDWNFPARGDGVCEGDLFPLGHETLVQTFGLVS